MKTHLVLAMIVSTASISLARSAEPECGTETLSGGRQATYCIQKPEGAAGNEQVLYYLHGLDGTAKIPVEQGLTADTLSATMIAVSFGPAWFFAPESAGAPGSATMKAFVEELMPKLEARLGSPVDSGKRAVVGGSMGGFNAAQLFEQHGDLFRRVALLCPGLSEISPYADEKEILDYIKRTGADPVTVARAIVVGRLAFPTEDSWNAATQFNPENLGRVSPQSPPLFVSVGRQDEWGFYEGSEAFVEKVRERGLESVVWKPVDGKHCSFDRAALSEFLAE